MVMWKINMPVIQTIAILAMDYVVLWSGIEQPVQGPWKNIFCQIPSKFTEQQTWDWSEISECQNRNGFKIMETLKYQKQFTITVDRKSVV